MNRDCDPGQTCDQGTCVTRVAKDCGDGGPCRLFATSERFPAMLGGVEGADEKCQAAADGSPLTVGGTYKAWISDSEAASAPVSRFTNLGTPGRYVLVDEAATVVARDWADLTTLKGANYLRAPFNVSEDGESLEGGWAWTNVTTAGEQISNQANSGSCGDWVETQVIPNGYYGEIDDPGEDWTDLNFTIRCTASNEFHLYCFEQR